MLLISKKICFLSVFLINIAPWNVYFILHYHLFFRKDFFTNVYISVNTIFECSYLSFG